MNKLTAILLLLITFSMANNTLAKSKVSRENERKQDSLLVVLRNTSAEEKQLKIYLDLFYCSDKIEAYLYASKSVELARKLDKQCLLGKALMYLGSANTDIYNFSEGLENYKESTEILVENKCEDPGKSYMRLGMIYYRNNNFQAAISYFHKALKYFSEKKDNSMIFSVNTYMANVYTKNNQLDSALYYLNFISSINFQDSVKFNEIRNIGTRGLIYYKKQQLDSAYKYFSAALKLSQIHDNISMIVSYQNYLADVYYDEKKYDEAEKILLEALPQTIKYKILKKETAIHEKLNKLYETTNQYEKALYHYKAFVAYTDSIQDTEREKSMNRDRYNLEIDMRMQELDHLNKSNNLQQTIILLITVALIILATMLILLFVSNKRLQSTTRTLHEQKKLVEEQNKEKALLLRELNHRVKNNLQMVSGLLNLQMQQLGDHPAAKALESGLVRIEALTVLHQKLYRFQADTQIDIKDFIRDLVENLTKNLEKDIDIKLETESFTMLMDKAIPMALILNELITNAIKYGKPKTGQPAIEVKIKKTILKLKIQVTDNGKGIDSNYDWQNASSFGLKLVHSFTRQLNGSISYSSEPRSAWSLEFNRNKLEVFQ